MSNPNDTLYGGREVKVEILPTAKDQPVRYETFFVRQFRVGEYRVLFPISDDEIALAAKACDKPVEVIGLLAPESYEKLHAAIQEVNEKGFFTYQLRQLDRAMDGLRGMPPELLKSAIALKSPLSK